jgi:hypothetical protein
MAKVKPNRIRYPTGTFSIPDAASAPGCGGIRQCTAYSEHASTVAIKEMDIMVFALIDFASPLRIIKPESQNMGIPEIKPVIPRATAAFFSPVFDRIKLAMLSAPPVLSRMIAMIAPKIIRSPMDAIVVPKPSFIMLTTSPPGIAVTARNMEIRKSDIKALSLRLEVSNTIQVMLTNTSNETVTKFIRRVIYLFKISDPGKRS